MYILWSSKLIHSYEFSIEHNVLNDILVYDDFKREIYDTDIQLSYMRLVCLLCRLTYYQGSTIGIWYHWWDIA